MCECMCVHGVRGRICDHVECVGHCGLACSAQGPLPAFEVGIGFPASGWAALWDLFLSQRPQEA